MWNNTPKLVKKSVSPNKKSTFWHFFRYSTTFLCIISTIFTNFARTFECKKDKESGKRTQRTNKTC